MGLARIEYKDVTRMNRDVSTFSRLDETNSAIDDPHTQRIVYVGRKGTRHPLPGHQAHILHALQGLKTNDGFGDIRRFHAGFQKRDAGVTADIRFYNNAGKNLAQSSSPSSPACTL